MTGGCSHAAPISAVRLLRLFPVHSCTYTDTFDANEKKEESPEDHKLMRFKAFFHFPTIKLWVHMLEADRDMANGLIMHFVAQVTNKPFWFLLTFFTL